MVNAGISTKNTYSYLIEELGGSENVGFNEKDCYNHVNTKKMSMISVEDAQSLLNHFKKRQIEDPMFFLHNSSRSRKLHDEFFLERWEIKG